MEQLGGGDAEEVGELHHGGEGEVLVSGFEAPDVAHGDLGLGSEILLGPAALGSQLGDAAPHAPLDGGWIEALHTGTVNPAPDG